MKDKKLKKKAKETPKSKEEDLEVATENDFGGFPENVDLRKNMGCGG